MNFYEMNQASGEKKKPSEDKNPNSLEFNEWLIARIDEKKLTSGGLLTPAECRAHERRLSQRRNPNGSSSKGAGGRTSLRIFEMLRVTRSLKKAKRMKRAKALLLKGKKDKPLKLR